MTMEIHGVIPAGSEIRGGMTFAGGLWLDGKVVGDLTAQPHEATLLVISAQGSVVGDIVADTVIVYGGVEGNIQARRIEVLAGGRVSGGEVSYAEIQVAQGAMLDAAMRPRATREAGLPPRQSAAADEDQAAGQAH